MNDQNDKRGFRLSGNSVFCPLPREKRRYCFFALVLLCFAALTVLFSVCGIGCAYRFLFGVPCPGCGMTRACFCALRGDLKGAFSYHFMFPAVPVLLLFVLQNGAVFQKKAWNRAILCFFGAGFLLRWSLNLAGVLPA